MSYVTLSGNLNYTPPGGDAAINLPLAAGATYGAQSSGSIDVPSGSASGATFSISLGAVSSPVGFVIKNRGGTAVNIALNSAASPFRVSNNGVVAQMNNAAPAANPLTAVTVILVATQTSLGAVDYLIFGD
jgi:hypothetical protein